MGQHEDEQNVRAPDDTKQTERLRRAGVDGRAPTNASALSTERHGELIASFGPALARGLHVYCLDGGNVFDPLKLTSWLRGAGINPKIILEERLFISRAFTCHQLAGAVESLFTPLLRLPHPMFAMILGVEHLFMDEDIPLFERRSLFSRILATANNLSQRGLPLLITCNAKTPNPWQSALSQKLHMLPNSEQAEKHLRSLADGPNATDIQFVA